MHTITLISDLGIESFMIARVKAALLEKAKNSPIVDVYHNIEPGNIQHAILVSAQVRKAFKGEVIHVIAVNNKQKKHIAAYSEEQWYIAPDNGILPELLQNEKAIYYSLPEHPNHYYAERLYPDFIKMIIEQTFVALTPNFKPYESIFLKPSVNGNCLKAYYAHFDKHGNTILNLKRETFYQFVNKNNFKIYITELDAITSISESVYAIQDGELAAFFNAAGYLEITFVGGHVERLFGLKQIGFALIYI